MARVENLIFSLRHFPATPLSRLSHHLALLFILHWTHLFFLFPRMSQSHAATHTQTRTHAQAHTHTTLQVETNPQISYFQILSQPLAG